MSPSLGPAAQRAPEFMAPAPGNRAQTSIKQSLESILATMKSRPLEPNEIEYLKNGLVEIQSTIAQETGDVAGMPGAPAPQPGAAPPVSSLNGPEQDYGTSPGSSPANMGL